MLPIRKHKLYRLAMIVWGVGVFGVIILTISGNARPFLAPDQLPIEGPFTMVGVGVVFFLLGLVAIERLEKNSWKQSAEQAGLSPRGRGGIIGKPDLVGTVDGREIRVRTVKRKVGNAGESGSNRQVFTVVETDLSEPSEGGIIVSNGPPTIETENVPVDLAEQTTSVGDVGVIGASDDIARDAITSDVQEKIQRSGMKGAVHAGKTTDIYLDAVREATGSIAGSFVGLIEDQIEDRVSGDASTVGIEREGVVLDGDQLERQAQAVVAVTNGFENAVESDTAGHDPVA